MNRHTSLGTVYAGMIAELCSVEHRDLFCVPVPGAVGEEDLIVERAAQLFLTMSSLLREDEEISPVDERRYSTAGAHWAMARGARREALRRVAEPR